VTLEAGANRLALREVSARMRPETASLRSISHPGALSLIEQNFDFDLLTPAKLLEKYVGRNVRIVRTHPTTGAESIETATVLAATSGVVLRIGDRIETGTWFMNRCDYLDPALAWTGVKNSGRGATLSIVGYETLTRPKSYHLRTKTS
jgi:hypothetical protein